MLGGFTYKNMFVKTKRSSRHKSSSRRKRSRTHKTSSKPKSKTKK